MKFGLNEPGPTRTCFETKIALHLIATRVTLPAVATLPAGSAPRAALGELGRQKNMDTTSILKVAVLGDGRAAIFPESRKAEYQYVYREATGVPSRSWLQLVILSHVFMFWFFHRGLPAPPKSRRRRVTPFTTRPCWAHTDRST